MVSIIQYRDKCIGCNACAEVAYHRWRMSRKDGKSVLVGGTEKKGIFRAIVADDELEENLKAAEVCPVRIIRVEQINKKNA